jgi:hypothetical protein
MTEERSMGVAMLIKIGLDRVSWSTCHSACSDE